MSGECYVKEVGDASVNDNLTMMVLWRKRKCTRPTFRMLSGFLCANKAAGCCRCFKRYGSMQLQELRPTLVDSWDAIQLTSSGVATKYSRLAVGRKTYC